MSTNSSKQIKTEGVTPKADLTLNQKKKAQQWIWKVIFIFITIVSSVLFPKIYQYQTLDYFAPYRMGNIFDLLIIGIPFGAFFIYMDMLVHRLFDGLCQKYYINQKKYPDHQTRTKRCYTLVKWGFSVFYYFLTSVTAYYLLKNTSYMPTWLGGNGYCTGINRYVTSQSSQLDDGMKLFICIQFGKHMGRFFQHLFIRAEGNFYQYTLHHGLSTYLILFTYLMNFWLVGIFVLLIHDLSDFFLILTRAYRDCKYLNKRFLQFLYIMLVISWISCRIFLLSYCCVYGAFEALIEAPYIFNQTIINTMLVPGIFMAFMISALEVLQIFWTYHIITSFIEVNVSSKIAKHTYD